MGWFSRKANVGTLKSDIKQASHLPLDQRMQIASEMEEFIEELRTPDGRPDQESKVLSLLQFYGTGRKIYAEVGFSAQWAKHAFRESYLLALMNAGKDPKWFEEVHMLLYGLRPLLNLPNIEVQGTAPSQSSPPQPSRTREEVTNDCTTAMLFANWITGRVPIEDGNEGVVAALEKLKLKTGLVSDESLEYCAKRVFDALGKGVPKGECKCIAAFTRCYSVYSDVHLSEEEVIASLCNMWPSMNNDEHRAKAVYSTLHGSTTERDDGTVVVTAPDTFSGIQAQYRYLDGRYGQHRVEQRSLDQDQATGKTHEDWVVSLKNGDSMTVSFDITSFYGWG